MSYYSFLFFCHFHRVIGTSETPIIIVGNKRDLQRGRVIPRWNVSHLVKKTWKCGYIECSAKYNWHILLLFSELLKSVGCARCKHVHAAIRFQGALRRNRCSVMWHGVTVFLVSVTLDTWTSLEQWHSKWTYTRIQFHQWQFTAFQDVLCDIIA